MIAEDEATDNVHWQKDWISEIYIEAGSDWEDIKTEYYTYEVTDLLGDVRGFMGMFLGWSLLGIIKETINIVLSKFFWKFEPGK